MGFNVRPRLFSGLLVFLLPIGSAAAAQSEVGLKVVVLEGNGTQALIAKPVPKPLMVRVVDAKNQPVPGATVVFTAPANGPSSVFQNDSNSVIVFTNQQGVAMAQDYRANSTAGEYRIQVEAAYMGDLATVSIGHTNVLPKKSPNRLVMIAVVAGGAAVGLLAAKGGGGDSSSPGPTNSPAAPAPPTITLQGSSVGGTR